jgi:beta-galactosidase
VVLLSALRRVISRYSVAPLTSVPDDIKRVAYGQIKLQKLAFLFDMVDDQDLFSVVESENPLSMESLGQERCLSIPLFSMVPNT